MMKIVRDLLRKIGGIPSKGKTDQPEPTPSVPSEPKELGGPAPQQDVPVARGIGIESDPF